jgi:hypothetical protein
VDFDPDATDDVPTTLVSRDAIERHAPAPSTLIRPSRGDSAPRGASGSESDCAQASQPSNPRRIRPHGRQTTRIHHTVKSETIRPCSAMSNDVCRGNLPRTLCLSGPRSPARSGPARHVSLLRGLQIPCSGRDGHGRGGVKASIRAGPRLAVDMFVQATVDTVMSSDVGHRSIRAHWVLGGTHPDDGPGPGRAPPSGDDRDQPRSNIRRRS